MRKRSIQPQTRDRHGCRSLVFSCSPSNLRQQQRYASPYPQARATTPSHPDNLISQARRLCRIPTTTNRKPQTPQTPQIAQTPAPCCRVTHPLSRRHATSIHSILPAPPLHPAGRHARHHPAGCFRRRPTVPFSKAGTQATKKERIPLQRNAPDPTKPAGRISVARYLIITERLASLKS